MNTSTSKKSISDKIRQLFLVQECLLASEISTILGISVPNAISKCNKLQAIRIGKTRLAKYILPLNLGSLGDSWELYKIDEKGKILDAGKLSYTSAGFYLEAESAQKNLFGDLLGDGIYGDLPWFLNPSSVPKPIKNIEKILKNILNSRDTGAFLLGEEAKNAFLAQQNAQVLANARGETYPKLAEKTLELLEKNNVASNEIPMFRVLKAAENNIITPSWATVFFSGKLDNAATVRISDLLIAMHFALECLSIAGHKVAKSDYSFVGERMFLEVEDVATVGEFGRVATMNLEQINANLIAANSLNPIEIMHVGRKYFSDEDLKKVVEILDFAMLIGANLVPKDIKFYIEKDTFSLAPISNMLLCKYYPQRDFSLKNDALCIRPATKKAKKLAISFWKSLSKNCDISENFKEIALQNATYLESL